MLRTLLLLLVPGLAMAQGCPEKALYYWQAFPAGGESDISARHQQLVLKKRCPAIETIIQYKPGAGGALMWTQANALPADGYAAFLMAMRDRGFSEADIARMSRQNPARLLGLPNQ